MNLPKLSEIEEEVINFLQRSRNKLNEIKHESSVNESKEISNYECNIEDEKFLSDSNICHNEINKELIKQKNSSKIDCTSTELYIDKQKLNFKENNTWERETNVDNATGAPSSSDCSNFNEDQGILNRITDGKEENHGKIYNLNNRINDSERNNLLWNLLETSSIFEESYMHSKQNNVTKNSIAREYSQEDYLDKSDLQNKRKCPINKSESKKLYSCNNNNLMKNVHKRIKLSNICIDKCTLPEMSTSNWIMEENELINSMETYEKHFNESFNYDSSEECNDATTSYYMAASQYMQGNKNAGTRSRKSKGGDDKDTSSVTSNFSDKEGDTIEEIIIREKLNRMNNPLLEDSFNEMAGDIIYESTSTMQDNIRQRKELLIFADKLAEAIEYNISMRNYLYDLEHTLLRLVEGTKNGSAIKVIKRNTKSYKKRKFYYKFQAPYFKDKRGISCAPYVDESIRCENEKDCIEDYMRLYRFSQQPEIYEIYNAIKRFFLESNSLEAVNDENIKKGNKKRGRKKVIYDGEYNETDLYSMESQFVNFLSTYTPLDLQLFFDKQIDWFKVSSMPNLQGITAKECSKMWTMVLKPLLELGSWNEKESEQVLEIARNYNYQCWEEIAKELGTGRPGYLCFCHVMSKPIRGVTQNTGAWTKEEDDFLLMLIEKCCYGNSIMWGRIFYYFEDRTVTQVLNRWYRLNPALKRGKFTHNEDIMLMYCVEQFGRDFGKIATLFGNRSPIQLRERYFAIKDLIEETKLGEWSVEEDKLLLNLVEEYGESKWAEIAAEFPGRNRTQIRHRYTSVLKRWIANPTFQLESLKRHKRTTHIKSVNRVKQIDTSETDVRVFVENKLKTGKATLKRDKRAGKHPTVIEKHQINI